VKLTLFTVQEANRVVAEIKPLLERLIQTKRAFDHVQASVDVLTLAVAGASPVNPDVLRRRQLLERRQELAEQLKHGVAEIQGRGCLIKDLDRGLVDFYSVAGDRLIFLCWQLGEPEVGHWHPLEGGFAARQPLNPTQRG
jgi:hypothetical protein